MTTKLTLSIEKSTTERAKNLSLKTGVSISKMVEKYLNSITDAKEISGAAVKNISGALKDKVPVDTAWKDIKAQYLEKKYGL